MPGPYTSSEFKRADSDVPGPNALHYYWHHPSGLCHMAVWRPSASFEGAPVAMFIHGGLGFNPGWRAMESVIGSTTGGGKYAALAAEMSSKGWVVISIDYPTCGRNAYVVDVSGVGESTTPIINPSNKSIVGTWGEIHPIAFWPEQPAYVALAIQYVKSNWSGVDNATLFGSDLWGAGNSINPELIHLIGNSWGGTMALYTAFQPTGYYPYVTSNAFGEMDPYTPRASHRVKSVSAISPQIDFTQWHFAEEESLLGENYSYDNLQAFQRKESRRKWSELPMAWKRQSPWWVIQEGHPENENISCFIEFFGEGTIAPEENLTYNDWNPGTVRDDEAGGKAWMDPHNGPFQGKPIRDALKAYGTNESAPIRLSRVSWLGAASSGLGEANLTGTAYTNRMFNWLRSIGYPEEYV